MFSTRAFRVLLMTAAIATAATDVRAQNGKECLAPLPCGAGSACPTLDEAMRDAKESVKDRPFMKAGHGTCGDLRFVYQNSGQGSGTLYFNSKGELAAMITTTDELEPPCFGQQYFGPRLKCKQKEIQQFK